MRANTFRILANATTAVLTLMLIVGCRGGASGPETVAVTGTVMMDGQPVEGANVTFNPTGDDPRLASQATTDAAGKFKMQTHIGGGKFKSGIVPGKYGVAIVKLDTAAIKTTYSPPKNLLPKKYGDPKTSTFSADVAAGRENDFPFALKKE